MAKSKHYYIRKTHRWLGIFLGVQFLLWTAGGLYFSWSNIDEVHGDLQKRNVPLLSSNITLVSPSDILVSIRKIHRIDSVVSIQLIETKRTLPQTATHDQTSESTRPDVQ